MEQREKLNDIDSIIESNKEEKVDSKSDNQASTIEVKYS